MFRYKFPLSALPRLLFFPLSLAWMESIFKWWTLGTLFGQGPIPTFLFSAALGMLLSLCCCPGDGKVRKTVSGVLLGLVTFWFMSNAVYHTIFKTFAPLESLSIAGEAVASYWRETLVGIANTAPALIALAIPLLLWLLTLLAPTGRRVAKTEESSPRLVPVLAAVLAVALQVTGLLWVNLSGGGVLSPGTIYRSEVVYDLSVSHFGLLTTNRLDIQQRLFGLPEQEEVPLPEAPEPEPVLPDAPEQPPEEEAEEGPTGPVVYGDNVLAIDFDALMESADTKAIKAIDQWAASRTPTKQNQYTGMFEGKNLIFITAEAFWKYAVDPELTPTLYKLANEGFVFENFYNPLWWHSTIDGEYCHCTGLIPSNQVFAFRTSAQNSMPFCMGNMLRAEGYTTRAYHNNTYDYYDRDQSHPNMGYDYYAVGQGLEIKNTWPQSDLEMMEKTIPQALAEEGPFHNYYMTVSGHMNYSFIGNMMSYKHMDEVAHLDMSEEARAYLACNMEFDRAMEYVLEQLEAAGELENTVICISGDHYPYGMDPATWNELSGMEMDTAFEIFRSTLILWSGDMEEPIHIEKACASMDVLPTLLNLFGLEYDSRLLAGQDILSDAPGLVALSNRSYITDYGRYNAKTDTFTPNEGITVSDGYASNIYQQVSALFKHSGNILLNDYYGSIEKRMNGQAPWQ